MPISESLVNCLPSVDSRNGVLNEFQCFFVLRQGEWKSREITCKCNLRMLGSAWKPVLNSSNDRPQTSITFRAKNSMSRSISMLSLVNCGDFKWKTNDIVERLPIGTVHNNAYIKNAVDVGSWNNQKMIFCFWEFIFDGHQILCGYHQAFWVNYGLHQAIGPMVRVHRSVVCFFFDRLVLAGQTQRSVKNSCHQLFWNGIPCRWY